MANMAMGGYTFAVNPSDITMVRPDKATSKVLTYKSIGYFSWGASILGKELLLEWNYMPSAQFDQFDTFFKNDAQIVFDPQDGSSKTYNVEIMNLDGKYHQGVLGSGTFRKDIKMVLLIMSEV